MSQSKTGTCVEKRGRELTTQVKIQTKTGTMRGEKREGKTTQVIKTFPEKEKKTGHQIPN